MSNGREQGEWDRLLSLMTYIGSMWAEKPPKPADLVPERYRPQAAKSAPVTESDRQRRNQASFKALDAYFAQAASDRR